MAFSEDKSGSFEEKKEQKGLPTWNSKAALRTMFSRIFAAGESGLSEVEPPGLVRVSLSIRFSNWSVWKTLCT